MAVVRFEGVSSNDTITDSHFNMNININNNEHRHQEHHLQHQEHQHQEHQSPTMSHTSLLVAAYLAYIAKYIFELKTSPPEDARSVHVTLVISLMLLVITSQPQRFKNMAATCLDNILSLFTENSLGKSLSFSNLPNVASADALASLARASSVESISRMSSAFRGSFRQHHPKKFSLVETLATTRCFAPAELIVQLSLGDLAFLFEYAKNVSDPGFNRTRFFAQQPPPVRAVADAMDVASKRSGGPMVNQPIQHRSSSSTVNALYLIAASRIYAEWRTTRMVPGGNKRYAAAMQLVRHDMLRNLEKMERGVHRYLKSKMETTAAVAPTASVRQVLQYEIETSLHTQLPRLTDSSAANGLLWCLRQLKYQTKVFSNIRLVPVQYLTANDVAIAAYTSVYERYHRWTTKQIFQHTLGASPPLDDIMKVIIPATNIQASSPPLLLRPERKLSDATASTVESSDIDGRNSTDDCAVVPELPLNQLGKLVEKEWIKAVDFFEKFKCGEKSETYKEDTFVSPSSSMQSLPEDAEETKSPQMSSSNNTAPPSTADAAEHEISKYLEKMEPMEQHIEELLNELNMNDPSKV